jgi:membrane protein YqaA with SNARE-associated domain
MADRSTARQDTSDELGDPALARAAPPDSRTRKWLLRLKRTRHKAVWLFGFSFLETTVLPVPIEVLLIPYMAAERQRALTIAAIALAGCLLGALAGYAVGYFLFETVGLRIIEWGGWSDSLEQFRRLFSAQGFWAILALGILPIPFQVAMLAAGAAEYPLAWFALAAGLARGLRYYGLAALVKHFGPAALGQWHRHKLRATLVGALVLLAVWGLAQGFGQLASAA